jgi:hypothetical protein
VDESVRAALGAGTTVLYDGQRQAARTESRKRRRSAQITAATTPTARTEMAPGSQDGTGAAWLTDVLSSPAGRGPNSPRSCA